MDAIATNPKVKLPEERYKLPEEIVMRIEKTKEENKGRKEEKGGQRKREQTNIISFGRCQTTKMKVSWKKSLR